LSSDRKFTYTVDGSAPADYEDNITVTRLGTRVTRWIPPDKVNNFEIPSNLVLKNIQEFLYLIENKYIAHGSSLPEDIYPTVPLWKKTNPISFSQLVMYHSLRGNYKIVQSLLAIDYYEKAKSKMKVPLCYEDPIKYVQEFMGDEYENIRILLSENPGGAYIMLHNGKITIPLADARSTNPPSNDNIFGGKEIDENTVEIGYYDEDGIFVPETDETPIPSVTSDTSVITGYNDAAEPTDAYLEDVNGTEIPNAALEIHSKILSMILEEVESMKELYQALRDKPDFFLFDKLLNGPNADLVNTLENEYGVISTQTLSFPIRPSLIHTNETSVIERPILGADDPLVIFIISPISGREYTSCSIVNVIGSTNVDATVTVNGEEAIVKEDGGWEIDITVKDHCKAGEKVLTAVATRGDTTEITRRIVIFKDPVDIEVTGDVMPIDVVRQVMITKDIDEVGGDSDIDTDIDQNPATNPDANKNENQSVYEKLVSTAQTTGVQFVKITKEKPVIEPLQNDLTIEKVKEYIENNKTDVPDVRDIL